eukprot:g7450.t1
MARMTHKQNIERVVERRPLRRRLAFAPVAFPLVLLHPYAAPCRAELQIDHSPPPTKDCGDEPWATLHHVLNASATYHEEDAGFHGVSPQFAAFTQESEQDLFPYFRQNFKECREGFLSFLLYLSLHHPQHADSFRALAKDFARELNPLALQQPHLLAWPLFGQAADLSSVFDVEDNELERVSARPRFEYVVRVERCLVDSGGAGGEGGRAGGRTTSSSREIVLEPHQPVTRISPMAGMVYSEIGLQGSMDLLRRLAEPSFAERSSSREEAAEDDAGPGKDEENSASQVVEGTNDNSAAKVSRTPVIFDVGVFDGSDWAKHIVELGFVGVGFEMVARNRNLMRKNFPYWQAAVDGVMEVVPGERTPRGTTERLDERIKRRSSKERGSLGFFHLIGAALGASAKRQKVLSRYDYTSLALMGYLDGPPDMEQEEVAVVALDDLFYAGDEELLEHQGNNNSKASYFPPSLSKIDILKIDTEGAELSVLKGAEKLLRDTRVHYLLFEYQPAMLANMGTDHLDILHFVAHYGFHCYSLKLPGYESVSFEDFAAQYVQADRLQLKGMGFIEDIICENRYFEK